MKKALLATATISALAASFSAQAAPFGIYDPRSLAMGGVGVTTATARNASFFNPAALAATKEDEDFAFNLGVAARAADQDKLADDIDTVEEAGDALSTTLDQFDATLQTINDKINASQVPTTPEVQAAADAAGELSTSINKFNVELGKINGKNVELGAFAGSILAIPSKKIGIGLYVSGHADAGARFSYDSADAALLSGYASTASTIQANLNACASNPSTCSAQANTIDATGDGEVDNMQSKFLVRGVLVQEAGLSLARRFADWGDIDVGLTPKVVKVKTFDYVVSAQDTEIDTKIGEKEDSNFNFDVGVTKTYGDNYKAGLVIKNVIGQEYETALLNRIKTKAQARLGVSHHTDWTTVGLDVDLTKNQGLGNDFSKETQFLGIGAELDVWLLQLRLGYRHDLAGNYDGMPSVGLGLNLFGLHLDAAAAANDKEAAASVQLGLNF